MALVAPDVMLNSIMGKIYNVLTNGDDTVPHSENSFFSWATPGIPMEPDDFRFLKQGLTGVIRKAALDEMRSTSGDGSTGSGTLTSADLEKLRATDAGQLILQAESFARLVDFVPDVAASTNKQFASLSVMQNKGTLSDIYQYILRMSQVLQTQLPEDVKKKIDKFRGLLQVTKTKKNLIDDSEIQVTEPSPLVVAYNTKMSAYLDAALEYNSRRIDALAAADQKSVHFWAINASILRNKVKAAMADWISAGYKQEYEQIAAFLAQVMQRDMSLLKQQYWDDLEKAKLTGLASGSDFLYSAVVPGNVFEAAGWTRFGFASSDFNSSSNSSYRFSQQSTSGGGGFFGVFAGAGRASSASGGSASHVQFDSEDFSLSFEIAQVQIVRPWLKSAFLTSKCWRMDQNNPEAKSEVASDGGNPPKGLLPAIPTSMILIRNLVMHAGNSHGFSDFAQNWSNSSASGGGALVFGPFHLAGSHGRSSASGDRSSSLQYDGSSQTMTVPGTQVIGFKCQVLPKAPDPLASIKDWI